MAFTYDLNTPQGQCRLLIPDTDSANPLFSDAEINAAFQIDSFGIWPMVTGPGLPSTIVSSCSPRRAAATLIDSLAGNAGRLASALKVLDIDINTQTAAKDLRAYAKSLRDTEASSGAFAIVEVVNNEFSSRERAWKQLLRLFG